jgi:hypothetical protein
MRPIFYRFVLVSNAIKQVFRVFSRSENLGFGAKLAPGMPGKGPRLGPRSICTDFQPGRPILRLFRAAFRTPCDCIGVVIVLAKVGSEATLVIGFWMSRRISDVVKNYDLGLRASLGV